MNKVIELYHTLNPVVVDAFDNVVANVCHHREKNGYKSYMLTGSEPSVGTTTVAIELSISLSRTGWKTLLSDADMRKNSAYKRLNENTFTGLTDYIQGKTDTNSIIYPTNTDLLDYMPCGHIKDTNPLRLLYSHRTSKLLSILNSSYDFVIIDVPASNSAVDPHILSSKADATILVTALNGANRKYLEEARERLIKDGANLIGVIQNRLSMEAYKDYLKDYDYFTEKRYLRGNHLSFDKL